MSRNVYQYIITFGAVPTPPNQVILTMASENLDNTVTFLKDKMIKEAPGIPYSANLVYSKTLDDFAKELEIEPKASPILTEYKEPEKVSEPLEEYDPKKYDLLAQLLRDNGYEVIKKS